MVDWVLVELRLGEGPETTEGRRAGLLLTDGRIVDLDGASRLAFSGLPDGNYFVVVRHRNHLPAMASSPAALTNTPGPTGAPFDVILPAPLVAGDASADGHIRNDDKNEYWFTAQGQSGYLPGDFNLDGQVTEADRDTWWRRNVGRSAAETINPQ